MTPYGRLAAPAPLFSRALLVVVYFDEQASLIAVIPSQKGISSPLVAMEESAQPVMPKTYRYRYVPTLFLLPAQPNQTHS
ncbi:Uncharacterised protein [Corynebacterium minutissimum]|uniref:Uncharacterized protein n=1 Tax=Corynebacterium minutissimum TaxID=38301 RepID=A0A2X4R825_9CORY|nr:hypothetical protein NX84_09445 [Corynebacterium minutissimum]SQH99377.1 Uncharacterised protein [Corynebacterium minutissimum]VEG06434.1 Uncharacterised protein [Corynebacterium minutissimum]